MSFAHGQLLIRLRSVRLVSRFVVTSLFLFIPARPRYSACTASFSAIWTLIYVYIYLLKVLLLLAEVPVFSLRICKDNLQLLGNFVAACAKLVHYVANVHCVVLCFCVLLLG